MPPNRVQQRAKTRARAPRAYLRSVELLTRMREDGDDLSSRTLCFKFEQKTGGSRRSASAFVDVADVPEFEGESAWFEMEKVQRGDGRMWPWWRAVRQVEPPADA